MKNLEEEEEELGLDELEAEPVWSANGPPPLSVVCVPVV